MLFLPPQIDAPEALPAGEETVFGGDVFGTSWQVRAFATQSMGETEMVRWAEHLRAEAEAVLSLVDRQMSPWKPGSSIVAYNALPSGAAMTLPEPMRRLVRDALNLRYLTDGLFDPFIGTATDLWGFGPAPFDPAMSDADRGGTLAAREGCAPPAFVGETLPRCEGHRLDLCGIAKGLAVDLVAVRLAADPQVGALLVEIGGELKGFGMKADATPWWVDLDWASYGVAPRMRVALHNWACASSGVAERNYIRGERVYSHVIDPRTGEPTEGDLAGASVLDEQCWRADALATALLVAGHDEGAAMAERLAIPCVLIGKDGDLAHVSPAMTRWLDDD